MFRWGWCKVASEEPGWQVPCRSLARYRHTNASLWQALARDTRVGRCPVPGYPKTGGSRRPAATPKACLALRVALGTEKTMPQPRCAIWVSARPTHSTLSLGPRPPFIRAARLPTVRVHPVQHRRTPSRFAQVAQSYHAPVRTPRLREKTLMSPLATAIRPTRRRLPDPR